MTRSEAYNVLEVAPGVTQDELKKAYRKMAFKYHPDTGGNKDEFQKVNNAYSLLTSSSSSKTTSGSKLTPEQQEILKEIALHLLRMMLRESMNRRTRYRPKKRNFFQRMFDWT